MKTISDKIDEMGLKDRFRINENGQKVLAIGKEHRGVNIAATESTRVANEGILNHFGKEKIKLVRWTAILDGRTDPECEALDGAIFPLKEASGQIPLHPGCRCIWTAA